jgi:RHS repeat-associated protein
VEDGRGTVRMLTNAAGAVTDAYEYDAFGNLIAQTGTTPNAYLYRGERYDSDLGLYYLRARWYNPASGRFMSRDPYGGSIYDPASLHRYNYARANPVNYIDPSGRSNLTEYALDLSLNTIATGGVVTSLGFSVKCAYFTVASSLHLVGETLGQQVDQFTPLFKSCAAKITTTQFVTAWAANTALLTLNVFAGPALTAVGDWMFGAEQGEVGLAEDVAPGGLRFGGPGDPFLQNASKANPVSGALDVAVHGTPTYVEVGGQAVSPEALANMIKSSPEYTGQPIRLLSCSTGCLVDGFAQNLANALNVPVYAPNDIIWAWPNGVLTIGPDEFTNSGSFVEFLPAGGGN